MFLLLPLQGEKPSVHLPRVSLLRRLPWARDRLAFQAALIKMWAKISPLRGSVKVLGVTAILLPNFI